MKKKSATQPGELWRRWEATCQRAPQRVLLIEADAETVWTAEALTSRARHFTEQLDGLPKGARVAFRLPNSADWMAFFLATQHGRQAAMSIDAATPAAAGLELAHALRAHALFQEGKLHLLKGGRRAPGTCCFKITSGSEGKPKAIPCRPGHLIADGEHVAATMRLRRADRNLAIIPLGHSYGLGNLVMPLILQGTSLVTAGASVPGQWLEWMTKYDITVVPLVPALLRVLASLPPRRNLGPVRLVISAGTMLSPQIARDFTARYGLRIHNFYGSSETGAIAYDLQGHATLTGRAVGTPAREVRITVTRGRIVVQSAAVAAPGGLWTLPDIGAWNERGELTLLGRRGQEANIGGKKVHPREIEQVLRSLPGVTDAAVWPERLAGREFMAAAVETPGTRAAIERALAERLPAWKIPRRYFIQRELPRTTRGKLDSAALRERAD